MNKTMCLMIDYRTDGDLEAIYAVLEACDGVASYQVMAEDLPPLDDDSTL